MAFGSLENGGDDEPLAEINMVPLIDVMLVLLIIFMVTAPLLTHAVKVDLPKASSTPNQQRNTPVQLTMDGERRLFWNGVPVDSAQLAQRLESVAAAESQAEVQLRIARTVPYENVAQLMSEAARRGVTRIGFVTEPDPGR